MKELILMQPDGGEQALEAIKVLALEKAADLIILDSIVACVPASELEGELADLTVYDLEENSGSIKVGGIDVKDLKQD